MIEGINPLKNPAMANTEKSKLKALSDIASIDITLDFDAILRNILKITCKTMKAHSGTIMLVDEKNDELGMVASYGLPDNYIERVYEIARNEGIPITSSPSGTAMQTGNYYVVPNIFEETKNKPWCNLGKELGFSAQIFTPMKRGTKVIGLLNVYMAEVHDFTNEEIDFVTIAASQAFSVVQNAMMCQKLENNLIELKDYKENLEPRIKESHKKLYGSEKYFNMIIESSFDGIMVVDERGRFEFGNDSLFGILGWPREELIGQFFMKVIPDNMKEFMFKRWDEVQNGMGFPYETKIITKSGEIRYLYVSHAPTEIKGKRKYVVIVKDVSEFKRLILNLKESEAKYRDLFENAYDPMYTHDIEGYFLSVNKAAVTKLGCTKEEIIGTNISRWLTPESFEYARETLMKHISGLTVEQPIILEIICKNGEHRWAEILNRVIKDGDTITGIHGIARDITEKKELEQELKESELKYRDLFENADDPIYTIDTKGFFQTINNAGCALLKARKEDIIGTHISKWLTPGSLESARQRIKRHASKAPVEEPVVYELVCSDGQRRFAEVRTRALIEGGSITGIHGMGRDITNKRILENKLLESEAKYRDLFENATVPMYILDDKGIFKKMNKAGLDVLGCTSEELNGSPLSKWITKESYKVYLERMAARRSGKPLKASELIEAVCKNGEHRWVETNTRAIKEGAKIIEIHGIARDITEKIKLERQIEEYHKKLEKSYEELKESDRIKTEFISNISHELLTPLTSIKGFAELIDDETMGKINNEQKKSLGIILRNSNRLIRLIKELLDAGHLEKNIMRLQFRSVSLNDILSKSIQDMHPQAKDKHITIIEYIEQLPDICGDEERLCQAMTNLLSNAIKFTPPKGKITVTAGEIMNKVKISIEDTGIGIPPDKLVSIFDRFYQVDGSSRRKYGGVGLGLTLCKSIIEKHHGSIWAESDGNGSTFHIELPKPKPTPE